MRLLKILFSHVVFSLVLLSALLSIFLAEFNIRTQFYVVIGVVIYYILWGVIHHSLENRTAKHIISEYVLLGLIGLVITLIVFMPLL